MILLSRQEGEPLSLCNHIIIRPSVPWGKLLTRLEALSNFNLVCFCISWPSKWLWFVLVWVYRVVSIGPVSLSGLVRVSIEVRTFLDVSEGIQSPGQSMAGVKRCISLTSYCNSAKICILFFCLFFCWEWEWRFLAGTLFPIKVLKTWWLGLRETNLRLGGGCSPFRSWEQG